jgi:hypothetical protein
MRAHAVVAVREGQLEDRIRVEGSYIVLERWVGSEDPRDDSMVCSAIAIRFPVELWPQYQAAIEQAIGEAAA